MGLRIKDDASHGVIKPWGESLLVVQCRLPRMGERSNGGPRTNVKGETLRKAILDAASTLFIERGVAGTSMRDISTALGLTRTAVYYYFKNKEEILKGLTEDVTLTARRMSGNAVTRRDIDAQDALRDLVTDYVQLILSRPAEFRVVDRNEEDMPPKLRAASATARRQVFENFSEVIQRGVDASAFRRVDARLTALAIIGMCNWTAWWFKAGGRKSVVQVASDITDLALHAVQAPSRNGKRNVSVPERLQELGADLGQIAEALARKRN